MAQLSCSDAIQMEIGLTTFPIALKRKLPATQQERGTVSTVLPHNMDEKLLVVLITPWLIFRKSPKWLSNVWEKVRS